MRVAALLSTVAVRMAHARPSVNGDNQPSFPFLFLFLLHYRGAATFCAAQSLEKNGSFEEDGKENTP